MTHLSRARRLATLLFSLLGAACSRDGGPSGAGGSSGAESRSPEESATDVRLGDATEAFGLDFHHVSGRTADEHPLSLVMGSGAAVFDLEGDGDLDLYLVQGNRRLGGTDRLFAREGTRYRDVSRLAGVQSLAFEPDEIGMGVAAGDVDGDGDTDLYLTQRGRSRLLRNERGRLVDAGAGSGAEIEGWTTSAAFADLDGDGDLDLFVARYVEFDPEKRCTNNTGTPDFCGPLEFPPQADVYLEGQGDATFVDRSAALGLDADGRAAAGLGVLCADFTGDGRPDVAVANDGYGNHLHVRDPATGTWSEEALVRGLAYNQLGQAEASMGIVSEDLDGDGARDVFMTHLAEESNTLYRSRAAKGAGRGGYRDASGKSGLGPSSMRYTGFGVAPLDIELDGDVDLCVANGRVFRGAPWPGAPETVWRHYVEPNLTYLNDGAGRFESISTGGDFETRLELSRALLSADLDGDGDLDLLMTNLDGPARVFENRSERRGDWLAIELDGAGRAVQGGEVRGVRRDGRPFVVTVGGGGGYLSAGPLLRTIGLGAPAEGAGLERLEVRWPDGTAERFTGAALTTRNGRVLLRRGTGEEVTR